MTEKSRGRPPTGYLVAVLSTIRVGEKLLQKLGPRKPMLMGCAITATGILLTTFTFLLAGQYMFVAFAGFTLFSPKMSTATLPRRSELVTLPPSKDLKENSAGASP